MGALSSLGAGAAGAGAAGAGAAGAGAAGAGAAAAAPAALGAGAIHAIPATADMMAATSPLFAPPAAGAAGAASSVPSTITGAAQSLGSGVHGGLGALGKLNDPLNSMLMLKQLTQPPPMNAPQLNRGPVSAPGSLMTLSPQPSITSPGASSSSPNMQQLIQLLQRMKGGSGSGAL